MSNNPLGHGVSDISQNYDPDLELAGKTEWEDALIKHKIMQAPKPKGPTEDEIQTFTAEVINSIDPLESKSLEELDELSDEDTDLHDSRVLQEYRERRLAELKNKEKVEKFGTIPQIKESEFVKEVSEASKDTPVICHLFMYSKPECQVLDKNLELLAAKFKHVKFVKIIAQECIHNYPDTNVPTLIIYKDGNLATQIVGLTEFGGMKMNEKTLEWVLGTYKILESNLRDNPLSSLENANKGANSIKMNIKKKGISNRANKDSEDDNSEDDD